MSNIKWVKNTIPKSDDKYLNTMSEINILPVKKFHESFPQYSQTPLVNISNFSKFLGVKNIFIKDESYRFGLNAFKVLGSSYAMAKHISNILDVDIADMTFEKLKSDEVRKQLGPVTFYTATDGNHGRGVAWAANEIGQKSVIYMPKGTTQSRLDNILQYGSDASIQEMSYDECVLLAAKNAAKNPKNIVIQDTAWDGYEEIPTYIMQGYGTMNTEAYTQMQNAGCSRPTHIFIQAGVGTLAGAVIGYFSNIYKDNPPKMIVVEPHSAACVYESAKAADGKPHAASGDMQSIMAGLCCGVPNNISWDILRNHVDCFISCDDSVTAKGMRILGSPLKGDERIISGESGAVCFGLLTEIMQNQEHSELKNFLQLDSDSNVLLFSTEGDTDPERYKQIVWDGEY